MNQSKGLKYGDVERTEKVAKPTRKRNTRKQSRPIESEVSDSLEKILVRHFQKVEKGMPWSKLKTIYSKYAEE